MSRKTLFDIQKPAPSEAKIISSFWASFLPHFLMALAAPLTWALMPFVARVERPFGPAFWFGEAVLTATCIWIVRRRGRAYSPVDESESVELLELCSFTPEGLKYRDQVVSQERKFVGAEVEMLRTWNDGLRAREANRKLYNPAFSLTSSAKTRDKASSGWEEF